MGVDSFWEGMDIKGSALSCVVIVKLPFPVPTEPLHMARIHDIEANGGNGFMDYSLPIALLKFKQGIGRLIRSKSDHGVIIVLDPRIHTKPYGKKFKNALDTHTILEGPLGTILDESVAWYDNEKQRSKT